MRELIEKYKGIIKKYEIQSWDSEPAAYRFKAKIIFIDESQLTIKDYLFVTGRKYSFHWQSKVGKLLERWDNAAHWPEINTHPHHKHKKGKVLPSKEVSLEEVLKYIQRSFKR
jgi:hypothetical protein